MKCFFILLFLCPALNPLFAQRPAPDQLQTAKGALTIQPVFHAGLVLSWDNKTIYVDPYGVAKGYEGLAAPDLILITDVHPDHLDLKLLNIIETSKAKFLVPKAVADMLPQNFKDKIVVLANGKSVTEMGITISAVPMYNLPEAADAMHTKGRGNGYILELGGKKIYISGDTEDIKEMRGLKNIDLAFICMNLPYTMDVKQASSAVLDFKPVIVYPYHYRVQEGYSDTEAFKKLVNAGNSSIEVRLRKWYTAY